MWRIYRLYYSIIIKQQQSWMQPCVSFFFFSLCFRGIFTSKCDRIMLCKFPAWWKETHFLSFEKNKTIKKCLMIFFTQIRTPRYPTNFRSRRLIPNTRNSSWTVSHPLNNRTKKFFLPSLRCLKIAKINTQKQCNVYLFKKRTTEGLLPSYFFNFPYQVHLESMGNQVQKNCKVLSFL